MNSTPPKPNDPALGASSAAVGGPAGSARDPLAAFLLGAALLLGLLRFFRLGHWSLWLDEVFTWGDAHSGMAANYNDLGYHLVRWTVTLLGQGPTEVALRLLPAVCGFACVPLTAWAFRPLAGPRRAALAALIVAVSAWQIQWAQTARFYTLCELMVLVGSGLAIRGLSRASVVWIIAGAGTIGASILFQLQGALIAGGLGAGAALAWPGLGAIATHSDQRRAAKRAFAVLLLFGLLASPFIWTHWNRYARDKAVADGLSGAAHFVLASASFATPTILVMAAAGLVMGAMAGDRRVHFVGAVLIVPSLALTVASTQAVVTAQYVFALFPWLALAAAWPVGLPGLRAVRGFAPSWAAALALPLLAGTGLYMTVEHGQRARWREATEFVMGRMEPGDLVAANPAHVVEFYLTGSEETEIRIPDTVMQMTRWAPRSWESWAMSGRPIWFVLRPDYLLEMEEVDRNRITAFLRADCRLAAKFPVRVEARDLDIEVWHFEG